MSHGASRPINVITVSRGRASVTVSALTTTRMHQDRHPPRPSVGSPVIFVSTNTFQVITPTVLAPVSSNATVTRGTGARHTQEARRPQVASSPAYNTSRTRTTPQPSNVSVASGRSTALSPSLTTASSAHPSSPRPRPRPPLSNPPYHASSSSDNQDRANSRGFHYVEGTQVGQARVFTGSRVGTGTPPVADADRRGRYLVGPKYSTGGGPMERRYLDGAWGVTPGTKESLGLTD